jgi:hypothetical protein
MSRRRLRTKTALPPPPPGVCRVNKAACADDDHRLYCEWRKTGSYCRLLHNPRRAARDAAAARAGRARRPGDEEGGGGAEAAARRLACRDPGGLKELLRRHVPSWDRLVAGPDAPFSLARVAGDGHCGFAAIQKGLRAQGVPGERVALLRLRAVAGVRREILRRQHQPGDLEDLRAKLRAILELHGVAPEPPRAGLEDLWRVWSRGMGDDGTLYLDDLGLLGIARNLDLQLVVVNYDPRDEAAGAYSVQLYPEEEEASARARCGGAVFLLLRNTERGPHFDLLKPRGRWWRRPRALAPPLLPPPAGDAAAPVGPPPPSRPSPPPSPPPSPRPPRASALRRPGAAPPPPRPRPSPPPVSPRPPAASSDADAKARLLEGLDALAGALAAAERPTWCWLLGGELLAEGPGDARAALRGLASAAAAAFAHVAGGDVVLSFQAADDAEGLALNPQGDWLAVWFDDGGARLQSSEAEPRHAAATVRRAAAARLRRLVVARGAGLPFMRADRRVRGEPLVLQPDGRLAADLPLTLLGPITATAGLESPARCRWRWRVGGLGTCEGASPGADEASCRGAPSALAQLWALARALRAHLSLATPRLAERPVPAEAAAVFRFTHVAEDDGFELVAGPRSVAARQLPPLGDVQQHPITSEALARGDRRSEAAAAVLLERLRRAKSLGWVSVRLEEASGEAGAGAAGREAWWNRQPLRLWGLPLAGGPHRRRTRMPETLALDVEGGGAPVAAPA